MAEGEEQVQVQQEDEEDKNAPGYKPPAQKSITEILKTDEGDESLRKYKETLLGPGSSEVIEEDNPKSVIMLKMSIVVEGRPDKEINLKDVNQLKKMKFVVKEGAKYKLKISFYVQREIVSGLKFHNKVKKAMFSSKFDYMAGSYGPKKGIQSYTSPLEEFPSGMISRGTYNVHSVFIDDDKNEILAWDWQFEIKKDWED